MTKGVFGYVHPFLFGYHEHNFFVRLDIMKLGP